MKSEKSTKGISFEYILDNSLKFAEKFKCYICKNLVVEAVCCESCEEIFCKECHMDFIKTKKNAKCPVLNQNDGKMCNYKVDSMYDLPKREKKFINDIQLKCFNYKNGCGEILFYESIHKHIKNCKYKLSKCNGDGCDFISTKDKILEHLKECVFIAVICEYCKADYKKKDIEKHSEFCDEKLKECYFCKKNIKIKDFYTHNDKKCNRLYYDFASKENIEKISKYEEVENQLRQLEEKLENFKNVKNSNSTVQKTSIEFLGKKKLLQIGSAEKTNCKESKEHYKLFEVKKEKNDDLIKIESEIIKVEANEEKKEDNLKEQSIKSCQDTIHPNISKEDSIKEESIPTTDSNSDSTIIKASLLWDNNTPNLRHNCNESVTYFCLLPLQNKDFRIVISLNKFSEEGDKYMVIGFVNEINTSKNFIIGDNDKDWGIRQDGCIVENNNEIDVRHKILTSFHEGDTLTIISKENEITFRRNSILNDYKYFLSNDQKYFAVTLNRIDDEIEIIDFE